MRFLRLSPALILVAAVECSSHGTTRARPVDTSPPTTLAAREKAFVVFESGQVRPLALSADGRFLYVTNTPDNRLEMFAVAPHQLTPLASVPVGLEPVAVAERTAGEVWVVNHLSDSVSVVDTSNPLEAHVTRTLLVGDEPRDITFAGPARARAFITTAHRGQNTGRDPQLTVPGIGRADVWVFDATNLGTSLGGDPLTVITLFSDTPRALAVSPDGATVFAAGFFSGNRTLTISEESITAEGGVPAPHEDAYGEAQPQTGLIVQRRPDPTDGSLHWLDVTGVRRDEDVLCSLPDKDVFAIDAMATPPQEKPGAEYAGVGTVLFNAAVNPRNGHVYVSNTEALNQLRFQGHDVAGAAQGLPPGTLRGHFIENRITVIDPATGLVAPRHLNKHIDYSTDGDADERARSVASPTGMAVSSDGATLYVAALGSSKVAVYDTAQLEDDSFVPSADAAIALSGGGPTGLALNEATGDLYALTRFDDGISIIDLEARTEVAHVVMYDPEPPSVTAGRRFLYDAAYTSGHGDTSCSSCHVFGDFDGIAWDLGDPDGRNTPVPGPFTLPDAYLDLLRPVAPAVDFPVKGPMVTQSLRGMANHGPMHWRGDHTGGTDASGMMVLSSAQPDTGTFDERAAFTKFNSAFVDLMSRGAPLTDAEMSAFTDFVLQITYPPNPIRNLDNSLTADQQAGHDFFQNQDAQHHEIPSDGFHNCAGCHVLNPTGNAEFGVAKPGFFGSDGRYEVQTTGKYLKVPHLRNLYQKVGMFQVAGDQVRGFGYTHDGNYDSVFRFVDQFVFQQHDSTLTFPANPGGFPAVVSSDPVVAQQQSEANVKLRRQVEAFLLAFDSNLTPIVGQQVTLTPASGADAAARLDLLEGRAAAGECDLVAKGAAGSALVAFLYDPVSRTFVSNKAAEAPLAETDVRRLSRTGALTFTAVPPGSGVRMGLDRDSDGVLDGDTR